MLHALLEKLSSLSPRWVRSDRVSIFLPFLIISTGLGVLAWRSYNLSMRMEQGASTLASQYAAYAADITARRVDAAIRAELTRANDTWQQMERRIEEPTASSMASWLSDFDWMVSAMYLPDWDPANSLYFRDPQAVKGPNSVHLTREFFTSSGTIKYTFDAARLLKTVEGAVKQQPMLQAAANSPKTLAVQQQADVRIVSNVTTKARQRLPKGFAFIAPLAPPLESFGIRAAVQASYIGSGWENQRVISLWLSLGALLLTGLGALLAWRGLHKEQETMKLRGALIANVSHELRTPLSMIRLGAETLKRGKVKDKERQDIEDQILREVLLLSHLVENVLDVARIQNRSTKALAFFPVHPRDLIQNLLTTYESWIRSKGFTVTMEIDDTIGQQMWDRDAVSRALLNLIDNAIKYSADQKHIEVVLRRTEEHVVIDVRDHGIGIDAKDAALIFDPYYRAKFSDTTTRRGAGLGLTLVQQILESHGGRVEVESKPGEGSTFRLMFPRDLAGEPEEMMGMARPREAF
jgi:signal transduction histidine kinase